MNYTISPDMNLLIPIVGQDPGPEYASDVNSSLLIIDQHNHTPGSGVAITPAAININADLAFNGNNAISLNSVRFTPLLSPIPATGVNLGCIYVAGVDLYYNDESGNQIQLTKSGAVAGTPGSISGLVSPASASYNSVSGTFVFESGTNTPAYIDGASIILRNFTANSQGLTLNPPPAMASSYSLTLPVLPASTLPVQLSNTGQFSTGPITFAQLDTPTQTLITPIVPTFQQFLSGSGTYTLPTSSKGAPLYIRVTMVGAGGGGAGCGPTAGGAGSNTTFGALLAGGGTSSANSNGAAGGTNSALPGGLIGININGGSSGSIYNAGDFGGNLGGSVGANSALGGGGQAGANTAGMNAAANSGAGGGGAGGFAGVVIAGCGGGSGGYISVLIDSPAATYSYSVGAGGAGGVPGSGYVGGDGADGQILVEEFYQ